MTHINCSMGESHIDESVLKQSWDALDGCWRKLDTLRTQYSHGQLPSEDTDRFVSGWQLFIFEARQSPFIVFDLSVSCSSLPR
jgi:hypothetical protein